MTDPERQRTKPGRPLAIPMELRPKVFSLYREGLGYRAIARELRKDGLCVDWSTIRRLLKTQGAEPGSNVPSRTLSTTILTRYNPVQMGESHSPRLPRGKKSHAAKPRGNLDGLEVLKFRG